MYRHYKCTLKPDIPLSQSVKFTVSLYEQAYYTAKSVKKPRNLSIIFILLCHLHKNLLCQFQVKDLMKTIVKKLYNQSYKTDTKEMSLEMNKEDKMKNYFDLTGQTAVVTGASTGLGVQMAKAFASQGANLVLIARRQNLLEENAAAIEAEFGVEVLPYTCDITDTEKVKAAVAATMERFGRIDILVNNAGTGAVAPAVDITDEQFNNELKIDLFGSFICAREYAKEMIKAHYGRIINIASMYGLVGNMAATCVPYHAAKGGVVNMTRALAAEWGKEGITVNSICPGYFITRLQRNS